MEKWEYMEEKYGGFREAGLSFISWLNKFGQSGWELVTTSELNSDYFGKKCIFKRKIQQDE